MHSMLSARFEAAHTAPPLPLPRRVTRLPAFFALVISLLCSAAAGFAQTYVGQLSGVDGPTAVAVHTIGGVTYLYVAEYDGGRVVRFNLTTGSTTPEIISPVGAFTNPNGIAFDPTTNDLFVTDRANNTVTRLTNAGVVLWTYGSLGTAAGQFNKPVGIARDPISGALYVAEHDNNRVQKFTVGGSGLVPVTTGWPVGGFNTPYGVAVNAAGEVYVADGNNLRVKKFSAAGVALPAGDLVSDRIVTWVTVAPDGSLYTAQTSTGPSGNRIQRFPAAGGAADLTWGGDGTGPGQFNLAFAVAVNGTTNRAYVSDFGNDRIQIFDLPAAGGGGGDTTAPSVASFTAGSASASPVTFTLTFDESVTGVDASDFTVTASSGTANITGISPGPAASSATYTVTVAYTGTSGTVQLTLNASGTGITDASSNAYAGGGTRTATFTIPTGADTTAPTVSSFTIVGSDASSVTYQIVFSETVTGVNSADFTAVRAGSTGGTGTATLGTFTAVSGTTYTQVVNFTGTGGTVGLNLNASGTGIQDAASNPIAGGFTGPLHTVAGGGGTPDTTPPTVSNITILPGGPSAVTFQWVFSEPVTGVNAADFTAVRAGSTGGTGTATLGAFTAVNGTTYTQVVNYTGTGGTVGLNLNATGTGIQDAAGNAIAGGVVGPVFTVPAAGDTPPYATSFVVGPAAGGIVNFILTFNEPVTGVDTSDFVVTAASGTTATINSVTANSSGTVYTVAVNYSGPGMIYVTLSGSGNGITDATANVMSGGNVISSAFQVGGSSTPIGGGSAPPPPPPVVRQNQTLTFVSPASAIIVNQPVALSATATSGLPVTFSIVSGNASLSGNTVTLRDTSPVVMRASQSGSATYNAATPVDVTLRASRAAQSINFPTLANRLTTDATINLAATSSSGLPITYTLVSGPATLNGNVLTLTGGAGTVMIRAVQAGDSAFESAEVVRSFSVIAAGQQVYLGTMGSDPFAVVINKENTQGVFLSRLGSTGEGIHVRFNLDSTGNFTARGTTTAPTAAGARQLTLSGRVLNGVVTGAIAELAANFAATVQPGTGSTAALAGLYAASIPGSASGEAYLVVGPNGQAWVLSMSPGNIVSGSGTVGSNGNVNIALPQNGSFSATLDANTAALQGRVTAAGATRDLVGLGRGTDRTDRMVNLSSRLRVTGGDASRSVIAGFVVTGSANKQVLIRAVGPGLRGFGVNDALDNPRLQLFDSAGRMIVENDDWVNASDVSTVGDRVGAFRLTAGSRDSAIVRSLAPGAYTVVVTGVNSNGVVLIEVYDAATREQLSTEQLVNISTRGFVDTGDGNLIAGFVVTGNAPKRVLVRAIGPGLTAFGVSGALADPVLRLFTAGNASPIAQNDNWETSQPINANQTAATAAEITAASQATGAFALANGSRDAAIVITLMPGNYSAVVSGANNTTGAGLVEVYELPNP